MIFWKHNNKAISYEQFLNDVNSKVEDDSPYGYFVNLISSMVTNKKFKNISELIKYLKVNSDDITINLKTSGTTGKPKEINQSLKNTIRGVKYTEELHKWAFAYNHAHFAGLQVFFQAFLNQQEIVYLFDTDLELIPNVLNNNKITHMSCTPTFMKMLLPYVEENRTISNLSFGGEKFDISNIEKIKNKFPNAKIRNIYASSEAGSILTSDGEYFKIPNRFKNEIKVVNDELFIHKNLLGNMIVKLVDDVWYPTGDLVKYVDNNRFMIENRKSDIINVGGYKVNPSKVESVIKNIPYVQDVLITSKINSVMGNIVVAKIIASKKLLPDENTIREKIKTTDKLKNYERPLKIEFIDSFDLTDTGKVKRI
tara:strand:- start:27 stop:1130 length:1104 start_codon:yes stop_codon:yes gene_type:complete